MGAATGLLQFQEFAQQPPYCSYCTVPTPHAFSAESQQTSCGWGKWHLSKWPILVPLS